MSYLTENGAKTALELHLKNKRSDLPWDKVVWDEVHVTPHKGLHPSKVTINGNLFFEGDSTETWYFDVEIERTDSGENIFHDLVFIIL